MIICEQYDYIEIVCLFNYPIKLTMKSGKVIECIALDTKRNERKIECVKVECLKGEQNSQHSLVVLDDIAQLEVCVDNPHFHMVSFV